MKENSNPNPKENPFTGDEGDSLSLEEVKTLNAEWIQSRKHHYNDNEAKVIRSYFFGEKKIRQELTKPGSIGIRVYYGVNGQGDDILMMVAATADWKDIPEMEGVSPLISPKPCPPYCP